MKYPNLGRNEHKRKNPKFWYNGKLISLQEHNRLSVDEIRSWNDRVTTSKNKS